MRKFIPLSVPNLGGRELEYITREVQNQWVSTAGPCVEQFERKIMEYTGAGGAVACQSGTAGLHLAMQVCGIGQGDEVIAPTLTFVAAVNPIRYLGAEPILMDCDDGLCLDAVKVKDFCDNCCSFVDGKLINKVSRRHIKALVAVHIFGNLADIESLTNVAKKYNLYLIEDATEALGSYWTSGRYKGKFAGTVGDIGVFSFNGNKLITTGSGGMIVSENLQLLSECRHLSTQAKIDDFYFIHDKVGYNYRMTSLQAAMGLAQLEQIEGFIETKHRNYFAYRDAGLLLLEFREDIRPNYWFYSLITNERDKLISNLSKNNIQTRPIWRLMHTLPPYQNSQIYSIEKAEYYYRNIVNVPCSSNLDLDDLAFVVEKIKESMSKGER